MKRSTVVLLLFHGFFGLAQASEQDERAQAMEIPCHPLITQAECRSHHDLLARLSDRAERDAYLTQYFALLAERLKSCDCSRAQNSVGALR